MIGNNNEAVPRGETVGRTWPRIFSYRLCIMSSASNCDFFPMLKHHLSLLRIETVPRI